MTKGKKTDWMFEAASVQGLVNAGWRKSTLKAGDTVTLVGRPLRDGRPGAQLLRAILADGTTLKGSTGSPKLLSGQRETSDVEIKRITLMMRNTWLAILCLSFSAAPHLSARRTAAASAGSAKPDPLDKPGALAKENLAKSRPKPPFNLTGNWMFRPQDNRDNGVFAYLPLPKLKPAAQAEYDAAQKAQKEGKAYKNDEGACWPAGMPEILTRVWPNQTIQLPTMILMVQNAQGRTALDLPGWPPSRRS